MTEQLSTYAHTHVQYWKEVMRLNILTLGGNILYLTLKYDLIYRLLKYIHWIEKVLLCFKISEM